MWIFWRTLVLKLHPTLVIPQSGRYLLDVVKLDLFEDDGMYTPGGDKHYLSCGASALNAIMSAVQIASIEEPKNILDFGSGAGRVTRWLRAAYPDATISACDLRERDLSFCRNIFGATTWPSVTDIDNLQANNTYDLIWLGSVITHLSPENTVRIFKRILSWLNPLGVAVISFHGERALERQNSGEFIYIHNEGWQEIRSAYIKDGYGYANYEGQDGYGISVASPSWILDKIKKIPKTRLVTLSETAWDNHHDIVAFQRIPNGAQ